MLRFSFLLSLAFIFGGIMGITLIYYFWQAINNINELKKELSVVKRRTDSINKKLADLYNFSNK